MDHLPPRPRAAPAVWPERSSSRDRDRSPARPMAHPREREPRDRDRDRDNVRERERPPHDDVWAPAPPRRDDVYMPPPAVYPPAYARERDGREWVRESRDAREWARDGRDGPRERVREERHYRSGGFTERGWADERARDGERERERERERFRERDREPRGVYDRAREPRVWERDERTRDREGRYGGGETYYGSTHARRPGVCPVNLPFF
ncbi:hypothetical protein DFH11DRAFT_1574034 [Phellopilus nigrolimitatus]|nr:hypothetical protein DFH11DRAFT_1574034 [Phellopilus nigrolimitatus]